MFMDIIFSRELSITEGIWGISRKVTNRLFLKLRVFLNEGISEKFFDAAGLAV